MALGTRLPVISTRDDICRKWSKGASGTSIVASLYRVAQLQVFLARRPRFGLNPEPDYCYHYERRHCFQRHRASPQALAPPDTQSAILVHQVRRICDHTVWVTCEWKRRPDIFLMSI